MALSDCACQITWIQSLLGELSYKLNAIPICGDNQGSIFMASNPVMEPHSNHIDIHYHDIHKSIANGKVELFLLMVLKILPICSPRTYPMRNSQSSELN